VNFKGSIHRFSSTIAKQNEMLARSWIGVTSPERPIPARRGWAAPESFHRLPRYFLQQTSS
jgi:hypothetical protein